MPLRARSAPTFFAPAFFAAAFLAIAFFAIAACTPAHANAAERPSLVAILATNDPAAILDRLVELGRTIDLADRRQRAAAIGPVANLPTRGSLNRGFVGYDTPAGEIVIHDPFAERTLLLVSPKTCIPAAMLHRRLASADFAPPIRPITVALYTDVQFRRPGTWLTFIDGPAEACIQTLGIAQRKSA